MKKFNSIFAIAAVALVSVFGFTSCEQTEVEEMPVSRMDQKPEQKKKEGVFDYKLFAGDQLLALGDIVVTVECDGVETAFSVSGSERERASFMHKAADGEYEMTDVVGKQLVLNNLKMGSKVTPVFVPNEAAIASLPADGVSDLPLSIKVSSSSYIIDMRKVPTGDSSLWGLRNERVQEYVTRRLAASVVNFSK